MGSPLDASSDRTTCQAASLSSKPTNTTLTVTRSDKRVVPPGFRPPSAALAGGERTGTRRTAASITVKTSPALEVRKILAVAVGTPDPVPWARTVIVQATERVATSYRFGPVTHRAQ